MSQDLYKTLNRWITSISSPIPCLHQQAPIRESNLVIDKKKKDGRQTCQRKLCNT